MSTMPDALAAVAACPVEHIRQGLAAFAISGTNPGGMICDRCAAIAIASAVEAEQLRILGQPGSKEMHHFNEGYRTGVDVERRHERLSDGWRRFIDAEVKDRKDAQVALEAERARGKALAEAAKEWQDSVHSEMCGCDHGGDARCSYPDKDRRTALAAYEGGTP